MNDWNLRFAICDLRLRSISKLALVVAVVLLNAASAHGEDWTMWGKTPLRNMISGETDTPVDWQVPMTEDEPCVNILWSAALGSKSYGNPVVSEGIVYVGTNNEAHRDPSITADGGVLMAFDEKTGKFLWQRYSSKLPTGR